MLKDFSLSKVFIKLSLISALSCDGAALSCNSPTRRLATTDRGEFYKISPALALDLAPRQKRIVEAVESLLTQVDSTLPTQFRGTVRHDAVGLYGSGFLAYNRVSNDLDVSVDVHLGAVSSRDPSRRDAARALLERMEAYHALARQAAAARKDPTLVLDRFMESVPETPLQDQEQVVSDLANSIRLAHDRKSYIVAIDFKNFSQVSYVEPGIAYVPLVTNIQFYSNAHEQRDGIFTGVRKVAIEIYYTFDLKVEDSGVARRTDNIPLSPLAPPHQVAKFWQQAFSGVSYTRSSADIVAARLAHAAPDDERFVDLRLDFGLGFIGSMSHERSIKNPVKFMKRFHHWFDVMGATLKEEERVVYIQTIKRELNGDAAILAEQIKTEMDVLRSLAETPEILDIFVRSGDVARVLSFFSSASHALRSRHAGLASTLDELDSKLKLFNETPEALRDVIKSLKKIVGTLVQTLGTDDNTMRSLLDSATETFTGLGFRPVRGYALPDGVLALRQSDLGCGDDPRALKTELERTFTSLNGKEFGVLEETDPRLADQAALPHPAILYLRCATTSEQQPRFLDVKRTLQASRGQFHVQP